MPLLQLLKGLSLLPRLLLGLLLASLIWAIPGIIHRGPTLMGYPFPFQAGSDSPLKAENPSHLYRKVTHMLGTNVLSLSSPALKWLPSD